MPREVSLVAAVSECGHEWDSAGGCRRNRKGWSPPFAGQTKRLVAMGALDESAIPKFRDTGLHHVCAKPKEHPSDHVCQCGIYGRPATP